MLNNGKHSRCSSLEHLFYATFRKVTGGTGSLTIFNGCLTAFRPRLLMVAMPFIPRQLCAVAFSFELAVSAIAPEDG
jgi:hypothetical protein